MLNRKIVSIAWLAFSACLLVGCATTSPLPTTTGKPDVTFQASKEAIFNALTDELLTAGYMLMNVNETKDIALYVIQHPNLKYSGVDAPVDQRATVNFVQTPTGVRVMGSVAYVTASGVVRGWPAIDQKISIANHNLYAMLLRVQQNIQKN